jgi:hypothetical protein
MASNADFLSYVTGRGANFNKYSAGKKRYGASGRSAPNIGPSEKSGYRERDRKAKARRAAYLRRIKAGQQKRYMSSDYQNPKARSY